MLGGAAEREKGREGDMEEGRIEEKKGGERRGTEGKGMRRKGVGEGTLESKKVAHISLQPRNLKS